MPNKDYYKKRYPFLIFSVICAVNYITGDVNQENLGSISKYTYDEDELLEEATTSTELVRFQGDMPAAERADSISQKGEQFTW